MIKNIDNLKKKSISFITKFLDECTVEEKIDTYYVSVEIRSKNNIVFIKSNGKVIDRCDLILNEMWQQMFNDWTHFKMVNQDWFDSHIGYKIFMFYFPCSKPILTEYKDNISYVIDRMEYGATVIYDCEEEMKDMKMIDNFKISFKKFLKKSYTLNEFINKIRIADKENNSYDDVFESIIDKENSIIFASGKPEGYIFKSGKKYIYQIVCNKSENRVASAEKSQYEFLLLDFIKFWNNTENIEHFLDNNYIKTVCNLYNLYISQERKIGVIEKNIDPNSLQSPCIGKRFDICYINIPDEQTINNCKESELYKNIFKILLVNLKRMKNENHCILMNNRTTEQWNDIVRTITNITI